MFEQNKLVVRRFYEEAYAGGKLDLIDELFATSYVGHSPAGPEMQGPEGAKQVISSFRAGFPDLQFTIHDEVAERDKVAVRSTLRGTHLGAFFGIPPTGKAVTLPGITIHRIASGKIVESWISFDNQGLMQQLGLAPGPGQGGRPADG